uniref:RNA-dependent RNA polymerase n=1 Tax=Acrobeloides nanus TaxID=290746 RepID=A0A914E737_9BILA
MINNIQPAQEIFVESVSSIVTERNDENDLRYEYTLKIFARDLPSKFMPLLEYFKKCMKDASQTFLAEFNLTLNFSFMVMSNEFAPEEFCAAHLDLPTLSIHFGNIVENSTFLNHRCVQTKVDDVNLKVINRILGAEGHNNKRNVTFTNMEHDKRMLIVKFPFIKRLGDPNNRKSKFDATVALYTKYQNFRRIIVDIQKIGSQNKFELKIYFTLFAPMTIKMRKFDMGIPAQNNNTNYCDLNQLAGLLSRGSIIKDQLLKSNASRDEFLVALLENYDKDKRLTLEAMERLLITVDDKLELGNITTLFKKIMAAIQNDRDQLEKIYENHVQEGYVRVRKIIITPTRTLYALPELLMSNRVLRKLDKNGQKTLRVVFRDEDSGRPYRNNVGDFFIDTIFHGFLLNGINVAGKHFRFLGCSNSQLRDNGCYFYEGTQEDIVKIRKDLGRFKLSSVPELMSRMGQCFTQAKAYDDAHYVQHSYEKNTCGGERVEL